MEPLWLINEESHVKKIEQLAEAHGVYFMKREEMYAIRDFLSELLHIDSAVYARRYVQIVEHQAMMFHKIREATRWSCLLYDVINMHPVTCIWHELKLDLPGLYFIEGENFYCHEKAPDEIKMALTVMEELLQGRPVMKMKKPKDLIYFLDSHYKFTRLPEVTWPKTFDQVMAKYRSLDEKETKNWISRIKYEKKVELLFRQHGMTTEKAIETLRRLLLTQEVSDEEIHEIMADLLI